MTTKNQKRYISFSATATQHVSKHLADIFEITNHIENYFDVIFDKVILEYDSDDNIMIFELTFSANTIEECDEVAEKLCDRISEYSVDVGISHLEIHEVVYA